MIVQGEGVLGGVTFSWGVKEAWALDRQGSPWEAPRTCWTIMNSEELRAWEEGSIVGREVTEGLIPDLEACVWLEQG